MDYRLDLATGVMLMDHVGFASLYAVISVQHYLLGVWVISDNKAATKAIIVCSYLFVCSFAVTMGPVSWTYPAELVGVE